MVWETGNLLLSICLVLPFMTGCTTMMTVNAGRRKEVVMSFDQVQQSDDCFLVQYTIGTNSLWHKNVPREQRIQLLMPEQDASHALDEMPSWGKTASSIPIRGSSSSYKIAKTGEQKQTVAYVVEGDYLVIVEPGCAEAEESRVKYRPDRAHYRCWWGYPICIFGTPAAVVADIGLLPVQIVILAISINEAFTF